jgi:hypothetical protein
MGAVTRVYAVALTKRYSFILGNTAGRIITRALQHQQVLPPSKGLCVPPEGELASDIIRVFVDIMGMAGLVPCNCKTDRC